MHGLLCSHLAIPFFFIGTPIRGEVVGRGGSLKVVFEGVIVWAPLIFKNSEGGSMLAHGCSFLGGQKVHFSEGVKCEAPQ